VTRRNPHNSTPPCNPSANRTLPLDWLYCGREPSVTRCRGCGSTNPFSLAVACLDPSPLPPPMQSARLQTGRSLRLSYVPKGAAHRVTERSVPFPGLTATGRIACAATWRNVRDWRAAVGRRVAPRFLVELVWRVRRLTASVMPPVRLACLSAVLLPCLASASAWDWWPASRVKAR